MSDAIGAFVAFLAMLAILAAITFEQRIECGPDEWMPEPGICERVTPERLVRTPRGGWLDTSERGVRRGSLLHCTGGARLRQRERSAWCQR